MKRFHRPSPAGVLALLALFAALGGSAFAASGTIFSSTVPKTPLRAGNTMFDASIVSKNTLIPATTATVAIDRITFASYAGSNLPRTVTLDQWFTNSTSDTNCDSPTDIREAGVYEISQTGGVVDNPTTPLIFQPKGNGDAWCLTASVYPGSATDSKLSYGNVSGFLVKGTPPLASPTKKAPSGDQPIEEPHITIG